MNEIRVVSIIPYKILPARLGGEKGIAVFNEYVGKLIPIMAISTRNNDVSAAKNYTVLNRLANSRIRYFNIFLYFTLRKLIRKQKATHLLIEHPYYGWLAWLLKKTMDITWVVHSHNIEFERSRSIGRWWWKALKWYEQWVYKCSDINFFISEDDRNSAISNLGIKEEKSFTITYGVEIPGIPDDIEQCKRSIRLKHDIGENEKILLFNGALYHHSNYNALQVILDTINPVLLVQPALKYKILVCGKGLPDFFDELKAYSDKNIIYAGFVDDISIYFKAADIFLNTIMSGGGVKTKAIEAIAYNCSVVSSQNGAIGLFKKVCGDKLAVTPDNDWEAFTNALLHKFKQSTQTSPSFYEYYYWGNIAQKVEAILMKKPQN
jgi:glycosyltransferase involved in cell wall biosynthesis